MKALQRFVLRMMLATVAIATIAITYVVGYYTGYGHAWHEAYFQPAIAYVGKSD
jgi:hypothetical protein